GMSWKRSSRKRSGKWNRTSSRWKGTSKSSWRKPAKSWRRANGPSKPHRRRSRRSSSNRRRSSTTPPTIRGTTGRGSKGENTPHPQPLSHKGRGEKRPPNPSLARGERGRPSPDLLIDLPPSHPGKHHVSTSKAL